MMGVIDSGWRFQSIDIRIMMYLYDMPRIFFLTEILQFLQLAKSQLFMLGSMVALTRRKRKPARWQVFSFFYQILEDSQMEMPSCRRCFAELVMLGSDI